MREGTLVCEISSTGFLRALEVPTGRRHPADAVVGSKGAAVRMGMGGKAAHEMKHRMQ